MMRRRKLDKVSSLGLVIFGFAGYAKNAPRFRDARASLLLAKFAAAQGHSLSHRPDARAVRRANAPSKYFDDEFPNRRRRCPTRKNLIKYTKVDVFEIKDRDMGLCL